MVARAGEAHHGEESMAAETPTAKEMIDKYGVWSEHPEWPVEDWKTEVENNDTRAGYWDWVASQIELNSEE